MSQDYFKNIPDSGSPSWKRPVAIPADLPPTGNTPGDARITLNNDDIYVWTGTTWVPVASPGAVGGITALNGDVTANGPGVATATVQFVGGSSATNVHTAELATNAATSLNTPNTIVKRDSSGNFAAGTITASITGDVSGSSSTFTGTLLGDVTGTQSATTISSPTVTNKVLTGLIVGTNTPILSTDSILIAFEKLQAQSSASSGSAITALTGDATATGPGSVPITLTTVNGNIGSFGSSTSIPNFTVNAKGLITAAGSNVVIAPAGTLTGTTLSSNVVSSSLTSVGTLTSLTVSGTISASNFSGSSSGTNTGDVTLSTVGSSPNANAASLSGQVLNLQPASSSFPGVITIGTQTIAGSKTFSSDLTISSTSTTALTINSTSFVFDATNNALGINTTPSSATFIDGVNTSNATKRLLLTGYGTNSLVGIRTRLARNTLATPQAVQSGDILGFFNSQGYGTSQFPATSTGAMTIYAGETFSNTSNATYIGFNTTPTGAVNTTERLRINSTGNILIGTTSDNASDLLQVNGSTNTLSAVISGTGGNGFIQYNNQSSAPSTPTSSFRLYSDNSNRFSWIGTNGFTRTFDGTSNTANRIYVLPDVAGIVQLDTRKSEANTTVAGTVTISSSDAFAIYLVDTTSSRTINLPTATSVGTRRYIFKDITGTAETNNISIVPNGTDQIEGINTTKIIQTNFGTLTLVSDGSSKWWLA